jgi:hypothetical protein
LACVVWAAAAASGQRGAADPPKDRDGPYTEYYPNGKIKRQARFKAGRLDGPFRENTEDGQPRLTAEYRGGKLHGTLTRYEYGRPVLTQQFADGRPVYARGLEQIKKELARIGAAPPRGAKKPPEREVALRRLRAYRYLAGVPYDNLILNGGMSAAARAASRICDRLGRMDHAPPNPGLPEAEYRAAFRGAAGSNLAMGFDSLAAAVDGWMDDSDAKNLPHLGHRRWCLHPWLRQVGFGTAGRFHAMWVFDATQKDVPAYDFIAYPAAGLMPLEFFRPSYAWSVVLDPRKYRPPDNHARPRIYRVDRYFNKLGGPVKLTWTAVDARAYGVPNCVIFRPEPTAVAAGQRCLVEIPGLRLKAGDRQVTLRYLVEFVSVR